MITRIVKLSFHPEHIEEFIQMFKETQSKIENSPGCNSVRLMRDVNQPNQFFTYSKWDSEDDLNNYRHSDLFITTWTRTKQWFNDKPAAWSIQEAY